MCSLGDETVVSVCEVFHLVDNAVWAGVQIVPLGYLSLGLGAWVLQVSGFAGRDSVSGLVAANNGKRKRTRVVIDVLYYSNYSVGNNYY